MGPQKRDKDEAQVLPIMDPCFSCFCHACSPMLLPLHNAASSM